MAAGIRLRPILMTMAATVPGVLPLVLASGAGGRFNMGLVIMAGISIASVFTQFVVPAMYMLLAREHARYEKLTTPVQTEPTGVNACRSCWHWI